MRRLFGAILAGLIVAAVVVAVLIAAPGFAVCVPMLAFCWFARPMSWESEWEAFTKGAQ